MEWHIKENIDAPKNILYERLICIAKKIIQKRGH